MQDAASTWTSFDESWKAAFEEAWTSFASGSAGVGAVITAGDGAIVATGRSLVLDQPDGRTPLAGTYMAHAEMNALACLPVDSYDGYTLYSTFEPCVMCAATIRIYRIPRVCYAPPAVIDPHDAVAPGHLELARSLAERGNLRQLAGDGVTVVTAATSIWDELQALDAGR